MRDGASEGLEHASLDSLSTLRGSSPVHEIRYVFTLHPDVETAVSHT